MGATTPVVTQMRVVPVAGYDSMLMTLSGAHAPYFIRNLVILTDSIIQYLKYMGGLFTGNLGHSTLYNSPVREVIAQRLPATICVSLISAVFVLLISVPIGIISGVTRGSMADFSLMFFVVILQSMSVVWVCAVAPDFCSEAGHSPLHGVLRLIKASVPRHASHRNGLPYVRPSSQNGTFQHDRCA